MRLEGAHDSRAVNRRARGAETRRPRASGGLCRAWGSVLFCKAACLLPGPRPWPARSIQIRLDAHGLVGLWMQALGFLRNPYPNPKSPPSNQTACLIYAYRPRQAKQLLVRC